MDDLENLIQHKISEVYDPEIPVNIVDLGLIYNISVLKDGGCIHCDILMTLTTPNCPVAESLPEEVKQKALAVPDIDTAEVKITWDPPWTPDKLSDIARLELGFLFE